MTIYTRHLLSKLAKSARPGSAALGLGLLCSAALGGAPVAALADSGWASGQNGWGQSGQWPYSGGQSQSGQYSTGSSGNPQWSDQSAGFARWAPIMPFALPGQIPASIPVSQTFFNLSGASTTYQPAGPTTTGTNAFFLPLGSNGRTCASCHAPAAGWSLTPAQVQALFYSTGGADPLFQPVDGANCSNANVSTFQASFASHSLLLNKALIRVFEQVAPAPALQYSVLAVTDPNNCNTNPSTGLTSYGANGATTGFLSVYRRPLPAANLGALSNILSDGREASLQQQAIDANRIHAQAATTATAAQVAQMVAFESGLYAAQSYSLMVGDLTSGGVTGGPLVLSQAPFYPGINDAFGGDPAGLAFSPDAFTLYTAWLPNAGSGSGWSGYGSSGYGTWGYGTGGYGLTGQAKAAIALGEQIFNERQFTISGVRGLNDVLGQPSVTGTCTTCHDTPNAGTHSFGMMMDTGLTAPSAIGLDTSGLPVFTLQCNAGPLAGQIFAVTDPGRATLSGQCADIGRIKVLTLRNLAARPPYFHNGSAATLGNVVQFYNTRFGIGLSSQDQSNLIAFLSSL